MEDKKSVLIFHEHFLWNLSFLRLVEKRESRATIARDIMDHLSKDRYTKLSLSREFK